MDASKIQTWAGNGQKEHGSVGIAWQAYTARSKWHARYTSKAVLLSSPKDWGTKKE